MKSPWYVFWLIVLLAIPIDMALETFKLGLLEPPHVTVLKAQPMVIVGIPMTRAEPPVEDAICSEDDAVDAFDHPTNP